MFQDNEVRQALAFVENAVDALSEVALQAAATTLAAEVRRLQAVNQTVNAIWEDVDAYARNHSEIQLGGSVSQHALKLMKERDALAAELARLAKQEPVAFWWIGEGGENHGGPYLGMASEFSIDNVRNSGCSPQYLYAGPVPAVAAGLPAIGPYRDFIPAPAAITSTSVQPDDDTRRNDEAFAAYCANRAVLNGAPGELVEAAPSVPKKHEIEGQLSLAESEMINAKAWSAGYEAKRHIGFALTAMGCARALLRSAPPVPSVPENNIEHQLERRDRPVGGETK